MTWSIDVTEAPEDLERVIEAERERLCVQLENFPHERDHMHKTLHSALTIAGAMDLALLAASGHVDTSPAPNAIRVEASGSHIVATVDEKDADGKLKRRRHTVASSDHILRVRAAYKAPASAT